MAGDSDALEELAALRRENATLRETLDAIDGSVVVYDADLTYRFGNADYHAGYPFLPADAKLVGLTFEQVLGLLIEAGAVADPRAYADADDFKRVRRAEMLNRAVTTREIHVPDRDRWWQVRVKWTPAGHRVALRIDVTELKRLRQELLRTERMDTVGRLARVVAQDFNNLLAVIVSNLELIRRRAAEPMRVAALADRALSAAETGARLSRQLLTFAHRDLSQPRVLSPNALLRGMDELLRRSVGPDIVFAILPGLRVGAAYFDGSQFERAIVNLIMNAREAVVAAGRAGSAEGRITVTTDRTGRADGEYIAVTVADTGAGMTPEVAAQAFDPFFTTKPPGGGAGLGLSQVYDFVTAAGGEAQIDSAPARGTTVTMLLPGAERERGARDPA
jgi:signal transduction histidine kinase